MSYDSIIIGAGMSGLAAGIRLAMFGKKVCILEKHVIPGGLNSYYQREGFKFDVGLHAITNFATKKERGKPLTKLLKQLRIPYESFKLNQQKKSKIHFPNMELNFNNNLNLLKEEIANKFPAEIDNFCQLVNAVNETESTALTGKYISAKEVVSSIIKDPLLVEMIFCPLLIYGSAWENDMDFSQFSIMFQSIFEEGFARPQEGVRTIIKLLTDRFTELGGELKYRHGVKQIIHQDGKAYAVELIDGTILKSNCIISSAGLPETMTLCQETAEHIGRLSFTESILIFEDKPPIDSTITFYNQKDKYHYRRPEKLFDSASAVICLPNNFEIDDFNQGIIRVTYMANYPLWKKLEKEEYSQAKIAVENEALQLTKDLFPQFDSKLILSDTFSPLTIEKFTGHFQGTVYGSTRKTKDGTTPLKNLYICGTDQGFLGIVGSILSGISMANLHGLMKI